MPTEQDRLLPASGKNAIRIRMPPNPNKPNGDRFLRKQARKTKRRNMRRICWGVSICAIVFGSMVLFYRYASNPREGIGIGGALSRNSDSILSRARESKALVKIDPKTKRYYVSDGSSGSSSSSSSTSITSTSTATSTTAATSPLPLTSLTFVELAEKMIHPWYEASMMAVMDDPAWEVGINPDNCIAIRKCLLFARDMLDVFSPVFPDTPARNKKKRKKRMRSAASGNVDANGDSIVVDRSLWKELRTQYKDGYGVLGDLQDLQDLTYSKELLARRTNAVNQWKTEFLAFQHAYRIRRFLYTEVGSSGGSGGGGIDPQGCYYHAASHLFWGRTQKADLPCGYHPGVGSLRSLGSVQLEQSLVYLNTVRTYDTVVPLEHQMVFHNLRKILRIFADEYDLFGAILVPNSDTDTDDIDTTSSSNDNADSDDSAVKDAIAVLRDTENALGDINDQWTALDIYKKDNSHLKKQAKMAEDVDKSWKEFLKWEKHPKHDLEKSVRFVLDRLHQD